VFVFLFQLFFSKEMKKQFAVSVGLFFVDEESQGCGGN